MYLHVVFTFVAEDGNCSDTIIYKIKNMRQFYQYLIDEFKDSDINLNDDPDDPRLNDPNFFQYVNASICHYLYHQNITL